MTENKLKSLVNAITIIATIIIFSLIVLVVFQMINRSILNNKKTALQNELSSISTQIQNVENKNSQLNDNAYLEQFAREYYGYGKNGEKQFSTDLK